MTIATIANAVMHHPLTQHQQGGGGAMMKNRIDEFLEILETHRHHLHLVCAMLLLYYVRSNHNNNNNNTSTSTSSNTKISSNRNHTPSSSSSSEASTQSVQRSAASSSDLASTSNQALVDPAASASASASQTTVPRTNDEHNTSLILLFFASFSSCAQQVLQHCMPTSLLSIYWYYFRPSSAASRPQQQHDQEQDFDLSSSSSVLPPTATMEASEESKTTTTVTTPGTLSGVSTTVAAKRVAAAADGNSCPLLSMLVPKDVVVAEEILGRGYVSDTTIRNFLLALGEQRVQSARYGQLDQRFCVQHGAKLEDPTTFQVNTNTTITSNTAATAIPPVTGTTHGRVEKTKEQGPQPSQPSSSLPVAVALRCPECYAAEQQAKRCHSCKIFYPQYTASLGGGPGGGTEGPGLWCQSCDRMAFCNACLSNNVDGCGSSTSTPATSTSITATSSTTTIMSSATSNNNRDDDTIHDASNSSHRRGTSLAFGVPQAFIRRRQQGLEQRDTLKSSSSSGKLNYCSSKPGRITCHNCCCPNVFTNTMCGEFVCDDCGEQHLRKQQKSQRVAAGTTIGDNSRATNSGIVHEVCEECGKATCLDPNCLVCANFRLIHLSCGDGAGDYNPWSSFSMSMFVGSDVDGDGDNIQYYFGTREFVAKLRRTMTDGCVYMGMFFLLYKIWCVGNTVPS